MKLAEQAILLIDDDPNDIELAMLAFERHRLAPLVHCLNNGEEALRWLSECAKRSPSPACRLRLVILDLKMPKVDGFDVLQAIRKSVTLCQVPVVILTSSRMPSDIKQAYQLGCNAYVVKPVNHQEYIRSMERIADFWGGCNLVVQD